MAIKSVYLPNLLSFSEAAIVRITGDEHRHLIVARGERNEPVEIFDGNGAVWLAEIHSVDRKEIQARVIERRVVERSPFELQLGLALIRPSSFEIALEKAVEIGVTRVVPVVSARSIALPARAQPAPRFNRWAKIVVEAAKQSKQFHLPVVDNPVTFDQVLRFQAKTRIVFGERGGGPLKSALAGSPALYLIGPEGGWTDRELEQARQSGFSVVTLAGGILRSETAAIVGGALIRHENENENENEFET